MRPQRIKPEVGQESVWDYPRPPRLERSLKNIRVIFNEEIIAESKNTYRVLETSHPPVYYIPPEDVEMSYLKQTSNQQSYCEWKGLAKYYTVRVKNKEVVNAGWFYSQPTPNFKEIENYIAFYPSAMDACYVDREKVTPQPGNFYGGWITSDIVGPFKGESGTWGW